MISILLSSLRQPTAQMRTEKQIQRQQSSINGCLMQRTYRKGKLLYTEMCITASFAVTVMKNKIEYTIMKNIINLQLK